MSRISLAAICLLSIAVSGQPQPVGNPPKLPISKLPSSLEAALSAYSGLTGKTVLRSSTLSNLPESVPQLPAETNAAVTIIESHLREQGIELIQDGPLFVWAVSVGWTNSPAAAFLATLKPPVDESDGPRGTASFAPADLEQGLSLYAKLRSRTLLRSRALGSRLLYLQTRQNLTSKQLAYALTVLFALNGVAAVDDGEKFVQLVPIEKWLEAVAASPKAQPGVPVLDPDELPKFKPERPALAIDHLNRLYLQFFHSQPPWTPKPADGLMGFYAGLTDQKALPSRNYGKTPVMFEITTTLTKEELLYAIETTLRLEGLAIGKVGENRIEVISLGEQRRLEKEKAGGSQKR